MKITNHIEDCRKQRNGLSFAFLAERCPTSGDAPHRIRPAFPILPEENCVLVLPGTGGRKINLRDYNGMLKQTDNFVKNNIDSASSPVRVCVAICDFGKQHLDKIARKSAYFEAWYPQYVESLKHDIPQACLQETFNPLYIKDIFETAILPRITSQDGNGRLPLKIGRASCRERVSSPE